MRKAVVRREEEQEEDDEDEDEDEDESPCRNFRTYG